MAVVPVITSLVARELITTLDQNSEDCLIVDVPWWRSKCHLTINLRWEVSSPQHGVRLFAVNGDIQDKELGGIWGQGIPQWVWHRLEGQSSISLMLWNCPTAGDGSFRRSYFLLAEGGHRCQVIVIVGVRVQLSAMIVKFFEEIGYDEVLPLAPAGDKGGVWMFWNKSVATVDTFTLTNNEISAIVGNAHRDEFVQTLVEELLEEKEYPLERFNEPDESDSDRSPI